MDTRNQAPQPHESAAQAAKWDMISRIAAILSLPTIAFLAIILKLAWHMLEVTAPWLLLFFELVIVVLVIGSIIGLFLHFHKMGVITFFRTRFPAKAPGRCGTRLNEASSSDTEQQRGRYFRSCLLKKGPEKASLQRDEAGKQSARQA